MSGSRIASDAVQILRIAFATTNVTTGAYVQLTAATTADAIMAHIYNGSTESLKLAYGPSGSEVDLLYISPGENMHVPFHIGKLTRLAVRGVSGDSTTSELLMTLFY